MLGDAAANWIDFRGIESAKGHGNAASVQAFSVLHDSSIRDCRPNSFMHMRILVLTIVLWGWGWCSAPDVIFVLVLIR